MPGWIVLSLVFMVQEPLSSIAAILTAYHNGFDL